MNTHINNLDPQADLPIFENRTNRESAPQDLLAIARRS